MTDQAIRPMDVNDVFYLMRVLLFVTLLSAGYALSRPKPVSTREEARLLPDTVPEPPGMLPWQRRASEKAVERYAGSQERKWRRWNEAMFERTD